MNSKANHSGKILIVDDNPNNLKVLYTYLKNAGFEVLVAEDGKSGIEAVQHSQPEVILLDVMMPGMDGFEVCRRLKSNSRTKEIPVIFLTALSETVNKIMGFDVGGVDYITQPIENEEVVARVKTHLTMRRMRLALQQQNENLKAEIERRKEVETKLQSSNDSLEETVADRTAELSSSNQDLEQFAYIASHDLRQPLRKIRMCTEYLSEDYAHCFDEEAESYMGYITRSIDRMYLLIDDLLTYSRIGKQEETYVSIELDNVVKDCIEDLSLTIEEKQATINCNDLPTIIGNLSEMRQLFQNLIANALKFTGDRPPVINVSAAFQDKFYLFKVEDNGIGIEPQYTNKIFQMFQRLHTTSEYEGTGIGLAICQKIVTRYGGEIWVESELGKGSVFYFTVSSSYFRLGNNYSHSK